MSHPGNDRLHDQVSDHVRNRSMEYLEEYLEGAEGGDNFLGWLLCECPAVKRYELFKQYLDHKDAEKFYVWATDKAYEELTSETES